MQKVLHHFSLALILFLCGANAFGRPHRAHRVHRYRHSFYQFTGDNTFQVESYFAFESKLPQYSTNFPTLLLRYGIIDRLELNLTADATSVYDHSAYSVQTGVAPLQPGFKIRFNNPKPYVPSVALIGSLVIPKAATEKLQQTYWAPTLMVDAEQDLTKDGKVSLEYAGGIQWDADNFQRIYVASLNTEYDFNDNTSMYADFFMLKPERELVDLHADLGLNQYVAPKVRLDISAGVGFTSASPQYYFQGGLQFMFPVKRHKTLQPGQPKS